MLFWSVVVLLIGRFIYRKTVKSRCKKFGHIWRDRGKRLKCKRCGYKGHRLNIIKPMK